jgi:hypothetical protein
VYSVLAAGKRRQRQYVREGRREERERTLNNRIDRARFLAELDGRKGMSTDNEEGKAIVTYTAVDALGHVNVVAGRPPRTVLTRLRLNRDSLCRADGFAELAGYGESFVSTLQEEGKREKRTNASLLTRGIPPESVLATETVRDGSLLCQMKDKSVRRTEEKEHG